MSYLDQDDFGYDRGYEDDSRPARSQSSQTQLSSENTSGGYLMSPPGTRIRLGTTIPSLFPGTTDMVVTEENCREGGGTVEGEYCDYRNPATELGSVLSGGEAPREPETADVEGVEPEGSTEGEAVESADAPVVEGAAPDAEPSGETTETATGTATARPRRRATPVVTASPAELNAQSVLQRFGLDPASFYEVCPPPAGASARRRDAYYTEVAGMTESAVERRYAEGNARQWLDFYHEAGVPMDVALRDLSARGVIDPMPADVDAALPSDGDWSTSDALRLATFDDVTTDEVRSTHEDLAEVREAGLGSDATATVRDHSARLEMAEHWMSNMQSEHDFTREEARGVLETLDPELFSGGEARYDLQELAAILYNTEGSTVDAEHLPADDRVRVPSLRPDAFTEIVGEPHPLDRATAEYANAHVPVPPPPAGDTSPDDVATGGEIAVPESVPGAFAETYRSAYAGYREAHSAPTATTDTATHEAAPEARVEVREPTEAESAALDGERERMEHIGFSDLEISEYQRLHPNRSAEAIGHTFARETEGVWAEVPESERADVLARGRHDLRAGLIEETALDIRRQDPSIETADARLMAEQLYRENTPAGSLTSEGSALDAMIGGRDEVSAELAGMSGHSDQLHALEERTLAHEMADYETAARAGLPAGSRGFYADTESGRRNLRLFLASRGATDDPSAIRALSEDEDLGSLLDGFRLGEGREGSASRASLESGMVDGDGALEERIRAIPGLRGAALAQALERAITAEESARREDVRSERAHTWEVEEREATEAHATSERVAGEAHAFAMAAVQNEMQMRQAELQGRINLGNQNLTATIEGLSRGTGERVSQQAEALIREAQAGRELQMTILASLFPSTGTRV